MSMRVVVRTFAASAIVAIGLTASAQAYAQFILTGDKSAPQDVIGFNFSNNGTPTLTSIAHLSDPLNGFATQGRWTVGDLDRDKNFEVVFTFPLFGNEGRFITFTYDAASATYLDRGTAIFAASSDGRIFTATSTETVAVRPC